MYPLFQTFHSTSQSTTLIVPMPEPLEQNMQAEIFIKHQQAMQTLLKQVERSAAQQAAVTAGWKAALMSQERYRQDIIEVITTLRRVQKSRDGLDVKCDRAISILERLTDKRQADAQRIVAEAAAEEREQENEQADSTRYPSRWFYAFVLLALLTVVLSISLVPRKYRLHGIF